MGPIFKGQAVQNETDRLSRNVRNLPICAVYNPGIAQISFTRWRTPEITHRDDMIPKSLSASFLSNEVHLNWLK
jgi:hypothetical protein